MWTSWGSQHTWPLYLGLRSWMQKIYLSTQRPSFRGLSPRYATLDVQTPWSKQQPKCRFQISWSKQQISWRKTTNFMIKTAAKVHISQWRDYTPLQGFEEWRNVTLEPRTWWVKGETHLSCTKYSGLHDLSTSLKMIHVYPRHLPFITLLSAISTTWSLLWQRSRLILTSKNKIRMSGTAFVTGVLSRQCFQ